MNADHVGETDSIDAVDAQVRADIVSYGGKQFEETGNPVFAAYAFLDAVRCGLQPPPQVLDWLAKGMRAWLQSDGADDIGQLLGMRLKRGQRETAFARADRDVRDLKLMRNMDLLMHLGATREEAAALASSRFAPQISAETVKDMHARRGRRQIGDELAASIAANAQFKKDFLREFDQRYMSSKLKSML